MSHSGRLFACMLPTLLAGAFLMAAQGLAQDGPPAEFGPMDEHRLEKIGTDQPVLVIYAQANDYPILAGDLANVNADEDDKVATLTSWFEETSWGDTTVIMTQQRATGGNWYVLPEGILDYAQPSDLLAMEARDASQASAANPTPPMSIAVAAAPPGGGDPDSDFDSGEAGDYRYAVSSFKDGVESTLARIAAAVTVAEGDIVTITITKAAADDVDRYIVYRTGKGGADVLNQYRRIGYAEVSGASDEFVDRGTSLNNLASHNKLLTAAMEAADADVADFEAFNGIIVILFSSFLRGQAANVQSFDINGTEFKIQTINQSNSTGFGRFSHEMGHWIELPDQYDPVTAFARGFWTTMDGSDDRQYASWEKDFKLKWIAEPANVIELERPPPGAADTDETYQIVATAVEETSAATLTAVKIKSSDNVHYYLEGRDHVGTNVSDASASDIVVVMEAIDAWPPGIYPKRTLNVQRVLTAGSAAYAPDPTVEITFVDVDAGPPKSYTVNVKVKAQDRPDPAITPWGAPPWHSVDIWVDSEREGGGWDDPATAVPKPDNGEAAWVDHVNRVYAKISNVGPGDATGVQARFKVNTPGGIGDSGQFVDLDLPAPIDIPAGESRNVFAEWTPSVASHTCIKVEIEHIPGEESIYNNFAQENVTHFYTGSGSPWHELTFPMRVANPFDEPKRVELEVRGLEKGWRLSLANKWVQLEPKTYKTVNVTVKPPPEAPACDKVELEVYGMTQLDDFIQVYGGMNPIVHLADPIRFPRFHIDQQFTQDGGVRYYRYVGITEPAIRNREIAVIVTKPDDDYEVLFTNTDGSGTFQGTVPTDQPGTWTAQTYYAGDDCHAPTEGTPVSWQVPPSGRPDVQPPPPATGRDFFWCCVAPLIVLCLILIVLILILVTLRRRNVG